MLEHIADDGAALDELRRVLAPGGWLLIAVPTPPAAYDPNHVREGYTGRMSDPDAAGTGVRDY